MAHYFSDYLKFREEKEAEPVTGVTAKIKLQKKEDGDKEFTPFMIDKSNHANLAKVVKAFTNSNKVTVGYTTIEKNKGEVEPQLKKKSLYLTGGAVRDHLMGKTPNNYDLVTDATPSEIRMILSQNGFKEVKPSHGAIKKYSSLPVAGSKNKVFYASKWDKKSKEMEITAEVNGQPFILSTLSKSPKSKNFTPDDAMSAANIEEDASNRDFTINSMYIPLTNEDGPNSDLIDPFGGANHLKSGEIKAVGEKFGDRMKEDPMTAFRLLNHFNRFGKGNSLPDKYMGVVKAHKDWKLPSGCAKAEFVKGLENPDTDARKYMKTASDSGLLNLIFPNIEFSGDDLPEDLRNDRWMSAAWTLRKNNPDDVRQILMQGGWSKQEANDVVYLVKLFQWSKGKFDPDQFYDMVQNHSGLTRSKIKDWMQMAKAHNPDVDTFLSFDSGDLSPYQSEDDGKRKINPLYVQFMGRNPVGGEFDAIKRTLMTNRWNDLRSKQNG